MHSNSKHPDTFVRRHVGPSEDEQARMLQSIGCNTLDKLVSETIPRSIRLDDSIDLPDELSEHEYLRHLREVASKNQVWRSYIGLGYHACITPPVIQRNVLENPGWYTQYTPYQSEISQGRLEALITFQTMVMDLTAMPIANASLLDEATAAAEAMSMLHAAVTRNEPHRNVFLVSSGCLPQTIDVLKTRAEPLGILLKIAEPRAMKPDNDTFGILLQFPCEDGLLEDYASLVTSMKSNGIGVAVAADLLSLALLKPPGEWGADVVVGSAQRFGVPLFYGGPHAAYFACREEYKRLIPGRIIGVSVDAEGGTAYRMALQTREQHIRREKATSNICTAQALLAIMAGMYGVYHGPDGIRGIAEYVHRLIRILSDKLTALGYKQMSAHYFDTIRIEASDSTGRIHPMAEKERINFRYFSDGSIGITLDETVTAKDLDDIAGIFARAAETDLVQGGLSENGSSVIPEALKRSTPFMQHPVFNRYHSETEMMRYIKRLENRDLSLTHSMIPLGSCTMKLNAAAELLPVSWPEFAQLHPFVPKVQAEGYSEIIGNLEAYLCAISGLSACSLQPNSGAQGEYTGLLVIQAYHRHKEEERKVVLIPSSAHGTNPASAVMAGLQVVVVACDEQGNIDIGDLKSKASQYASQLSALMITYPSTHGVFEEHVQDVCRIIHSHGGQVYMDGANLNAMVGLSSPGAIGADVCHINLHKTFSIPHGGGGPGMGPICVAEHLAQFLPGHPMVMTGGDQAIHAVSSAPYGSAGILPISYGYIRMLGREGATQCTRVAILNANYIKSRLEEHYPILYAGGNGRVAHELIVDFRQFKSAGIEVEDVAKRLMDYSFHAPTVSFPVPGTLMIEPTESESKEELDRFCDALIAIREEIREVETGQADTRDNVLKNAPHTAAMVTSDEWNKPYSRQKAAYPLPYLRHMKFWPPVARVNNPYGDRNLVCSCPPTDAYAEPVSS